MDEKGHDGGSEQAVIIATTTPMPPPTNPETAVEKTITSIQSSKDEDGEEAAKVHTHDSNAEPEYPTLKKLIPLMAALYIAFFLVALVRLHHTLIRSDH